MSVFHEPDLIHASEIVGWNTRRLGRFVTIEYLDQVRKRLDINLDRPDLSLIHSFREDYVK